MEGMLRRGSPNDMRSVRALTCPLADSPTRCSASGLTDRGPPSLRRAIWVAEGAQWAEIDAVVYFWIRRSRIASATDVRLLAAIRTWLDETWALTRTVFVTNEQFQRQVHVLESAGLQLKFELREPGKPGTYLIDG
jgi:hypothetical protein